VDSHLGLPVINYDRARLNQTELAVQAGVEQAEAVMAAHIVSRLDPRRPRRPRSAGRFFTTCCGRRWGSGPRLHRFDVDGRHHQMAAPGEAVRPLPPAPIRPALADPVAAFNG
jgi:hypothetical protein